MSIISKTLKQPLPGLCSRILIKALLCPASAVVLVSPLWAAAPTCGTPPCGSATSCDNALVITQVNTLNFGLLAISPTVSGTVTIAPTITGTRTSGGAGGVVLLPGGAPGAASFSTTTGGKDCTTIPLVTVSAVELTPLTNAANTMNINPYTTSPIGGDNYLITFYVGGTLNVNANQAAGDYAGTYTLTITFQ